MPTAVTDSPGRWMRMTTVSLRRTTTGDCAAPAMSPRISVSAASLRTATRPYGGFQFAGSGWSETTVSILTFSGVRAVPSGISWAVTTRWHWYFSRNGISRSRNLLPSAVTTIWTVTKPRARGPDESRRHLQIRHLSGRIRSLGFTVGITSQIDGPGGCCRRNVLADLDELLRADGLLEAADGDRVGPGQTDLPRRDALGGQPAQDRRPVQHRLLPRHRELSQADLAGRGHQRRIAPDHADLTQGQETALDGHLPRQMNLERVDAAAVSISAADLLLRIRDRARSASHAIHKPALPMTTTRPPITRR